MAGQTTTNSISGIDPGPARTANFSPLTQFKRTHRQQHFLQLKGAFFKKNCQVRCQDHLREFGILLFCSCGCVGQVPLCFIDDDDDDDNDNGNDDDDYC